MATFGVEDLKDDIVSGSFFSFRFFEDSKRNWALGHPISVQELSYSLSQRFTRLASWRIFSLVVLDNFSPFFVPLVRLFLWRIFKA